MSLGTKRDDLGVQFLSYVYYRLIFPSILLVYLCGNTLLLCEYDAKTDDLIIIYRINLFCSHRDYSRIL